MDLAPVVLRNILSFEYPLCFLGDFLERQCDHGVTRMNLGVITRLLIPTHLRFLLSQMPKPNFLKQSKHIVFKEGMINDRLSFLLIELSLDQQRTLQQPLPDVIK